jgi:hypothetical protein
MLFANLVLAGSIQSSFDNISRDCFGRNAWLTLGSLNKNLLRKEARA